MRGRLFTLWLAALAVSGCLSVLAPAVDRSVVAHAAVRETTAPSTCLTCHRSEPVEPAPTPDLADGAAMSETPWVPRWMLQERGGECLACHGVVR